VEFLLHRSTVVKSSQVYARPALKKGKRGWKSYIHSTPQKQTKERNEIGSGTIELFIEAAKAKVAPKIHRILKTEGSADGKYQDDYFTKYANCGDLLNFLEANQNLCSELALELGEKLIQKVALLHSLGIAHRDIKPDNILVHENEENKEIEVYLCDFGFATKDSFSSQMPGSRNYFPPEYKQNDFGRREVPNIPQGPKIGIPTHSPFLVDCYTLGLTLFILLTKDSYEENLITHLKIHSEKLKTLYQQCANLQEFIALKQKISDQVIDENLSDWPENVLTVIKGLVRHLPSERITPVQALELWKEANGSSGKLPLVDPEEISLELD
jgi:serine/threonine protein kinase